MSRSRRRQVAAVGTVLVTVVLGLAACSNAKTGAGASSNSAPGVSSNLINVGSIANISGPLSSDFAPVVNGVEGYFSMVNAEGGVDGRQLKLAYQTDDQGSSTTDLTVAQKLVEQDHVFAVVGVGTPFFGGASYLAAQGVPTFGYSVSSDWQDRPSLFADFGSVLCFACGAPGDAYTAQQLGATSIAVVAYGVPQSAAACQAAVTGMRQFGLNVSYTDLTFPFGSDPTADVLKMKSANVDLLFTCLDVTGNVAFARSIDQNGLTMKQVWFNGYDRGTLKQYSSIMQGVYLGLQHVPFEAALAYPGVYPGMDTYIREMQKYQPSYTYNETALDGWIAADQFVTGLRSVGRNLTQKKLVAALNKETAYTGDGLTTPVNWETGHSIATPPFCQSTVQVQNGNFVPAFTDGSEVFTCFGSKTSDTPVPPPPGTPGLSSTTTTTTG
ncbi:MAG: ABC transporter substrate-binding protein [Acidimicrobiales bacterium]|jgi:branched-chain amino acid transport system substrate-binding protein